MRFVRILLAGYFGYCVDLVLTLILIYAGMAVMGIHVDDPARLPLNGPANIVLLVILPVLSTVVGGAVAGLVAPADPQPAGALVGGIGLIDWAVRGPDYSNPSEGTMIILQCVATLLAVFSAVLVARYRTRAQR
jgi:hypothetical protein